jgi:hypothetical protein
MWWKIVGRAIFHCPQILVLKWFGTFFFLNSLFDFDAIAINKVFNFF